MLPTDFKSWLTQERLKSLLHYEPETGVFTHAVRRSNQKVGAEAGFLHADLGYRRIKIDGRPYAAARLAWLYMTGEWPANLIDHRDLNRANDAWANLRAASHADNMRNKAAAKGKQHPLKGVYRKTDAPRARPWQACIRLGGVLKHLGTFTHPEEAHAAYAKAAKANFGLFARA